MALTDQSVRQFADQWHKQRPTLLFGHAHSLYVLAQYCERIGISRIRPRGIISTSMMLLPHERNHIERVFGCRVTDRYGCEEVSLIGCECAEHRGMHMNIEHLIIEFVKEDGTAVAPGEPGRIIVTDLMNRAMPFIRYSVEDIGTPIGKACPCGRALPLMGNVAGRVADFLVKKDGTKIAGVSIIENTLTKIPGIDQMQLVQEDIDHLVVNIVPGRDYDDSVAQKIRDYFMLLFVDIRVTLNLIPEIKPEASGKFRFSICKVPNS
jgi:phenylacetate-CoA ligase